MRDCAGWPTTSGSGRKKQESRLDVGLKRDGSPRPGWNDGPALAVAIGAGVTSGLSRQHRLAAYLLPAWRLRSASSALDIPSIAFLVEFRTLWRCVPASLFQG